MEGRFQSPDWKVRWERKYFFITRFTKKEKKIKEKKFPRKRIAQLFITHNLEISLSSILDNEIEHIFCRKRKKSKSFENVSIPNHDLVGLVNDNRHWNHRNWFDRNCSKIFETFNSFLNYSDLIGEMIGRSLSYIKIVLRFFDSFFCSRLHLHFKIS